MPDHTGRVSLREAGLRLDADPYFLLGVVESLRIDLAYRLDAYGGQMGRRTMAEADFDRIKALLDAKFGDRRGFLGDNVKAEGRARRA